MFRDTNLAVPSAGAVGPEAVPSVGRRCTDVAPWNVHSRGLWARRLFGGVLTDDHPVLFIVLQGCIVNRDLRYMYKLL